MSFAVVWLRIVLVGEFSFEDQMLKCYPSGINLGYVYVVFFCLFVVFSSFPHVLLGSS